MDSLVNWKLLVITFTMLLPQRLLATPETESLRFELSKTAERVVMVTANKQGSGVPILYGDQVVILTNSHVIGDKTSVEIIYHSQLSRNFSDFQRGSPFAKFTGSVLLNLPAYDVALISTPSGLTESAKTNLREMAKLNVQLCPTGINPCTDKIVYDPRLRSERAFLTGVSAVVDRHWSFQPILIGNQLIQVEDRFISGLYPNNILIPLITRPGVSGGGLFKGAYLSGLVSRVSSGFDATTYAVSIGSIAKLLSWRSQNEPLVPGRWLKTPSSVDVLEITDGDVTLKTSGGGIFVPAGGEIGGGGGEIGGGGSDRNSAHRYMTITDDGSSSLSGTTLLPFGVTEEVLEISEGGRSQIVSHFELNGKKIYPTLATYLWYRRHLQKDFRIVYRSEANAARSRVYPLMKYGRYYEEISPETYRPRTFSCDTLGEDKAQALYSEFNLKRIPKEPSYSQRAVFDCHSQSMAKAFDDEGYKVGRPFYSKRTLGLIADLKVHGGFQSRQIFGDPLKIQVAQDLSTIQIVSDRINLTLVSRISDESRLTGFRHFNSNDPRVSAVAVMDTDNLDSIYRLFIKLDGGGLVELSTCQPGIDRECVR